MTKDDQKDNIVPFRHKQKIDESVKKNDPYREVAKKILVELEDTLDISLTEGIKIPLGEHVLYFVSVFSGVLTLLILLGLIAIYG